MVKIKGKEVEIMLDTLLRGIGELKERVQEELSEMIQLTALLREEGIGFVGYSEIPNFVFIDKRLNNNARLLYFFLHSINAIQGEDALNHKEVANVLKMDRKEYSEAMDTLRLLGLVDYSEKTGQFHLVDNPVLDKEMIDNRMEEINEKFDEVVKKGNIFKETEKEEETKVVAKSIDSSKGNVNKQIFMAVVEEVAENIPDEEISKMKLEIDFSTGMVKVEFDKR